MIWIIRILILLIMATLNWTRGYHWRPISMLAMTFIMGIYFALLLHTWWLFVVVGAPMYACLSLHDGNRGVWCSLVSLGASVFLLFFGYLSLFWFIIYCGVNFILGWQLNKQKVQQSIIDPITGAGFGSLVFLI